MEDPVQVPDVVSDDHCGEEGEEHRGSATVRDRMMVEAALVRVGDEGYASREAPERECQQVAAHRGDPADEGIVADRWHDQP